MKNDPPAAATAASMYKLTYKTKRRKEMLSPAQLIAAKNAGWVPCFRMLVLTEAQADYFRKPQDPNLAVVLHQLIAPLDMQIADIQISKVAAAGIVGADA